MDQTAEAMADSSERSTRYNVLLNQVQQVNSELQEARQLISNFKRENGELIANFDRCKSQLVETRQRYEQVRAELLETTERGLAAEQAAEAFREQVLGELTSREESLRELQARLVPQDLDLLRIEIAAELEAPHAEKVAQAEAETKKWEALFYSVRRAYEKERTEHELFKEQVKAAIESDRSVFESEASGLRRECAKLRAEASKQKLDQTLAETERRLKQSEKRERLLEAEISDLRRSLEEADALRQGDATAAVEALARCESALSHTKADLNLAQTAQAQAQAAQAQHAAECAGLREQAAELSAGLDKARQDCAAAERLALEAGRQAGREVDRRSKRIEAEHKRLEDRLRRDLEDVASERSSLAQAARLARERCEAAVSSEEASRAEAKDAIAALQAEVLRCLGSEHLARGELKVRGEAHSKALRKASGELNEAKAQVAKGAKEAAFLQAKVDRLSEELSHERTAKEHAARCGESASEALRKEAAALAKVEARCREVEQASEAQAQGLAKMQKEYASLVAQLDAQRSQAADGLSALAEAHEHERAAATQSARRQHDELRRAAAEALAREKRRADKYKEAAASAHEAGKQAKLALEAKLEARAARSVKRAIKEEAKADKENSPRAGT